MDPRGTPFDTDITRLTDNHQLAQLEICLTDHLWDFPSKPVVSRCHKSNEWSTVLNALERSTKIAAQTSLLSKAMTLSLTTLVVAVSVCRSVARLMKI